MVTCDKCDREWAATMDAPIIAMATVDANSELALAEWCPMCVIGFYKEEHSRLSKRVRELEAADGAR